MQVSICPVAIQVQLLLFSVDIQSAGLLNFNSCWLLTAAQTTNLD